MFVGHYGVSFAAKSFDKRIPLCGIFLYMRSTKAVSPIGKFGMLVFGIILLLVQGMVFFGARPRRHQRRQLLRSYLMLCSQEPRFG